VSQDQDLVARRQRDGQPVTTPTVTTMQTPWRDDAATTACPVCGRDFRPTGRAVYCSEGCRKTAWRRRHQVLPAPVVVPAGVPRRPLSVYECPTCDTRAVGEQRCGDCGGFMTRVGWGGLCPHCGEAVAVAEVLDGSLLPPLSVPAPSKNSKKGRR
jgi:predicted amidophosphoribosyltransferase